MKSATEMEYHKVINYIIDMIRDGKLIVGSKIPSERDLSEYLGVGRNSTREAISIMRGLGLIESRHGSGNYIAKNSGTSIKNIVMVLLALGTISKRDVIELRRYIANSVSLLLLDKGMKTEDSEKLLQIVGKMNGASEEEFIELDKLFHLILTEATDNFLVITIMEPIGEIYLDFISEVIHQSDKTSRDYLAKVHASILESILKKDKEACVRYLKEHFDYVESKLESKEGEYL